MCSTSGSLDRLMMTRLCVCEICSMFILQNHLGDLIDNDIDPFERIPEEDVSLEEVPELSIDPDNSGKDEDIIIDKDFIQTRYTA